jgi:DNA-binding NarL/FixJ family response regulator
MESSMPVPNGFEATEQIVERRPDTGGLFVTGPAAEEDIGRAQSAGAVGYVTEDRIAAELVGAIREADADRGELP